MVTNVGVYSGRMRTKLITHRMLSNPFTKESGVYESIRTDHNNNNLINFSDTILGHSMVGGRNRDHAYL